MKRTGTIGLVISLTALAAVWSNAASAMTAIHSSGMTKNSGALDGRPLMYRVAVIESDAYSGDPGLTTSGSTVTPDLSLKKSVAQPSGFSLPAPDTSGSSQSGGTSVLTKPPVSSTSNPTTVPLPPSAPLFGGALLVMGLVGGLLRFRRAASRAG